MVKIELIWFEGVHFFRLLSGHLSFSFLTQIELFDILL